MPATKTSRRPGPQVEATGAKASTPPACSQLEKTGAGGGGGGGGGPADGVTGPDAADVVVPLRLVAPTVKVYATPFVNCITVALLPLPLVVAKTPSGLEVTV